MTEGGFPSPQEVEMNLLEATVPDVWDGSNVQYGRALPSGLSPSLLKIVSKHLASRHLLIQGPPKSGRSSLVFDLACDVAASTSCRCLDHNRCSCIAVTLFRPSQSKTQEDQGFPLHCRSSPAALATDESQSDQFSKHVLRRIQIRWIASLHDLLQQLYCLQGSPFNELPTAILLDDLDLLCAVQQSRDAGHPQNGDNGHSTMSKEAAKIRARQSLVCKCTFACFCFVFAARLLARIHAPLRKKCCDCGILCKH
jgi:hypothetical protein